MKYKELIQKKTDELGLEDTLNELFPPIKNNEVVKKQIMEEFNWKFGYYKEIFIANKEADALLNIYPKLKNWLITALNKL